MIDLDIIKTEKKKVMLVVDDEHEAQELIKEYLSDLNVEIYSAYSGEEGIMLYEMLMMKDKKPDLVIMDLNLSGSREFDDMIKQFRGEMIDGIITTQEIMKIDPTANIIGFTAYADVRWGEILKATGAKEVWGRGIGFDGFAKKVNEILA